MPYVFVLVPIQRDNEAGDLLPHFGTEIASDAEDHSSEQVGQHGQRKVGIILGRSRFRHRLAGSVQIGARQAITKVQYLPTETESCTFEILTFLFRRRYRVHRRQSTRRTRRYLPPPHFSRLPVRGFYLSSPLLLL